MISIEIFPRSFATDGLKGGRKVQPSEFCAFFFLLGRKIVVCLYAYDSDP